MTGTENETSREKLITANQPMNDVAKGLEIKVLGS
jgi:hypothetical protein